MNEINDILEYANSGAQNHEEEVRKVVRRYQRLSFVSWFFRFVFLVLIFYASMMFIDQKSHIYEMNMKNIELEKELNDIRSRISEVNVQISSQFSLESIYEIASKELGMIYPMASRVVSINSARYYSIDTVPREREEDYPKLVREDTLFEKKMFGDIIVP